MVVVGAGVVGMSAALALRDVGWSVRVVAAPERADQRIVSKIAAAVWQPYQVAHPEAARWAEETASWLETLYAVPEAGVRPVQSWELSRRLMEPPAWSCKRPGFRALRPDELPGDFLCGYACEVPLVETPRFMPWLRDRLESLGVIFEARRLSSLAELTGEARIVNASGLGARELVGDEALFPIRGQLLKVAWDPAEALRLPVLACDDDAARPCYIIPRSDGLILGGTAQKGDGELSARADERARIFESACELLPAVRDSIFVESLVGLRPGRREVRLELEERPGSRVVHNYGHGGAGFTLAWGCALEVCEMMGKSGVAEGFTRYS